MPTPPARRHSPLWPKFLFGLACLATLAVLVVTVMNRRNVNAQGQSGSPGSPSPELAAADKLVPPPVPDDQNFAATPYFALMLDKKTMEQSRSRWPDDFSRANQWPHRVPPLAESVEGRKTGRFITDMTTWKKTFDNVFDLSGAADQREGIPVAEFTNPATNALAALAVLEALKPYDPVLEELHAARQRPHSRFNIRYNWDNPWGILLPHLAFVKQTCQLLRLKASAELAANRPQEALDDILLMLRLVDSPRNEPMLISHLVRIACLEITFQPIWEGLAQRRWSEAQLQSLQNALSHINLVADLEFCLKAERVWGNLTIALFRDKRSPSTFQALMGTEGSESVDDWVRKADKTFANCPRETFESEQQNYNRLFDAYLLAGVDVARKRIQPRAIEENAHQLEKALRNKATLVDDHLAFSKGFMSGIGKSHLKFAGTQGYTDLAVVACALERHRLATGQFPESIAALAPRFLAMVPHDLVNGQPLHYERTGDGLFVLHSVGWNEADDRGELAFFASGRGPEKKEGDWVWRYPAPQTKVQFE